MKKLMFTVAAALCATVTFADVESGIVGYNTVASISAGQYVALGVQFENCAGGEIAVKDLLTVGTPTGAASIGNADQIWRWNTATAQWTKYFYYSSRGAKRWVASGNTAVETTDTVPAGETVFFCRAPGSAATSLTLAGAVKEMSGASSVSVSAGQLAFMANPWPTPVSVANFNSNYSSGTPTGAAAIGNADQIWRWNTTAAAWTKYYYYSSRGQTRWVLSTANTTATTDSIPAGEGFFFQRAPGSAAATISIAAPSSSSVE